MAAHHKPNRLPNAPLVEAVFELRWTLSGPPGTPTAFQADPGFLQAQEAFSAKAAKLGFSVQRDMLPAGANIPGPTLTAGHSVSRRFFVAEGSEFPILQIGPGIFATNQSAEYEWTAFKHQILSGAQAALEAYPKLSNFPLTPEYLELRYLNAFDNSLTGTTDLVSFLNVGTNMKVDVPTFLHEKEMFANSFNGRFLIQRPLRKWKSSIFGYDVGSGRRESEEVLRLETKVVTTSSGVPRLRKTAAFISQLDEWLEFAHGVTSPFFKGFITEDVMKKFGEPI
jgi:uncharacterized protein (TIGR04255 family)